MKFIIERASEPSNEVKPCEEAVREEYYDDIWKAVFPYYTITFSSYEELIAFTQREEKVIIDWACGRIGLPCILIYDDYIE